MPKEKITVSIAGIKMTLLTADKESVTRMANTIDASVRRRMKNVGGRPEIALVLTVMEQSESLKKNADLIRNQQEQIFSLTSKNSALLGEKEESAPVMDAENALLKENKQLCRRMEEMADEMERLKSLLKAYENTQNT